MYSDNINYGAFKVSVFAVREALLEMASNTSLFSDEENLNSLINIPIKNFKLDFDDCFRDLPYELIRPMYSLFVVVWVIMNRLMGEIDLRDFVRNLDSPLSEFVKKNVFDE